MEKITTFLKKIGLSPKEIRVYLYCLQHGPQFISQLAKVTNTTRTNTYDVVKKLETKGLCHTTGSSYGKKVQANDPEDIKELLLNKRKEITDLSHELDTVLPLFKTPPKNTLSPFTRVSYFEGANNVRKMIWQSLQATNKCIKIAGSELDIASALGTEYLVEYHERRKNKGITLQALRPDSTRLVGEIFENDKKYLREIKIRPKGKIRLKSNVILWDHYIAIYSLKDNIIFGTLFESEDAAIMFGTWFDFIWEYSKRV